jgi:hypothetical protein
MTNLPSEPEFEQAYKGARIILVDVVEVGEGVSIDV